MEQGKSMLEVKEFSRAITIFENAQKLDSENIDIVLYKSIALLNSDRASEAIGGFLQVIDKDKSERSKSAYLLLAIAYKKTNQPNLAIEILDKVIRIYKKYLKAFMLKGKLLIEQKKWVEAKKCFEEVGKINSNAEGYLLGIFDCEYHINNFKETISIYEKLIESNTNIPIKCILIYNSSNYMHDEGKDETQEI